MLLTLTVEHSGTTNGTINIVVQLRQNTSTQEQTFVLTNYKDNSTIQLSVISNLSGELLAIVKSTNIYGESNYTSPSSVVHSQPSSKLSTYMYLHKLYLIRLSSSCDSWSLLCCSCWCAIAVNTNCCNYHMQKRWGLNSIVQCMYNRIHAGKPNGLERSTSLEMVTNNNYDSYKAPSPVQYEMISFPKSKVTNNPLYSSTGELRLNSLHSTYDVIPNNTSPRPLGTRPHSQTLLSPSSLDWSPHLPPRPLSQNAIPPTQKNVEPVYSEL